VGAIIKYTSQSTVLSHISVVPAPDQGRLILNDTLPPDALWLSFPKRGQGATLATNRTYSYVFKGELQAGDNPETKEIEQKVRRLSEITKFCII
jgi:hypothetical protein